MGIDIKWAETGEALKLNGFHHNLNNSLGKRRGLNVIKKFTNIHGCYEADIIIGNVEFRGKTFFPDHWPRDRLLIKYMKHVKILKKAV